MQKIYFHEKIQTISRWLMCARSTTSTGARKKSPRPPGLSIWLQRNGAFSEESTGLLNNQTHVVTLTILCRYYMYFSKSNSLVWCKVPKAGSSTWTYNFLKLAGVNPKEVKTINQNQPKRSKNNQSKSTQEKKDQGLLSHFKDRLFQHIHKVLRDHYPKQQSNKVMQVS